MVMKVNQLHALLPHVVIISQPVDLTLLLWSGRVISRKMNKSSLKILEQNKKLERSHKLEEYHLWRRGRQLPRRLTTLVENLRLTLPSSPYKAVRPMLALLQQLNTKRQP